MTRVSGALRRLRWVHFAPALAFIALAAWAFASPIGAGPDDDYHLVSTWCALDGSDQCESGTNENSRILPSAFQNVACFAQDGEQSASCQYEVWQTWDGDPVEISRGNFGGEYPPVYYTTMRIFAGSDVQVSALAMRLFNAALFVGLATALAVLLPPARRSTLLWGWLITLVPLGMFLIPSNNPSGWALTGVGTAFLALLGWFETTGRRRWALGALYAVGMLMAAGSRGDAAVYAAGATVTALILVSPTLARWRLTEWRSTDGHSTKWGAMGWWRGALLPAGGLIVAIVFFANAGQAGIGSSGFTSGPVDGVGLDAPAGGFALAAYNLLMLPFLWTGVWGSWGLGWLDTQMPAIVFWAATSAFVAVAFAGIGRLTLGKAIATGGVLLVLIVLPVYVLTVGGNQIGENLQPRYLLPLIVLFAFLLVTVPHGGQLHFTRVQTATVLVALAVANLVSLQVNIRRYVTGIDQQGLNLDAGAEWWWEGLAVGPSAMWIMGALAYAALLATLWSSLRGSGSATTATLDRDAGPDSRP